MKRINFIIMFCLISCTSITTARKDEFKRRNLEEYFVGSGVIRYFMTDLPVWANFSESAGCRREISTRFLNIKKIRSSFLLSYEEAISLQHMFNVEWRELQSKSSSLKISFRDEEQLFFSISDKIQAGIRVFKRPKFERINLVWIDYAIDKKEYGNRLEKLMKSKDMNLGHPVFVSLCLNQSHLDGFIEKSGYAKLGVKGIPSEIFSVFDLENSLTPYFSVEFDKIFKKNQTLYLYLPSKSKPKDFKGKFKIKYY